MMLYRLAFFLVPLLLCACQGYKQYIPAPHEMTVNAAFGVNKTQVPEELITVQETQPIASDVLQTLMKARGYLYMGKRVIRSEYSPSISNIKKAAHDIGASNALYFIAGREKTREKRSKIELGTLVGGLVGAENKKDYQRALERGLKQHDYIADVTYYTYSISYWARTEDEKSMMLSQSEILLLKQEQKNTRKKIRSLEKQLSKLAKTKSTPVKTVQYYTTTNIVQSGSEERTNEMVAIRKELSDMKVLYAELRYTIAQQKNGRKKTPVDAAHPAPKSPFHFMEIVPVKKDS